MINTTIWISIIYLLLIGGCSGVSDEPVVGDFFLGAVDYELNATCLYYRLDHGNAIGVVPAAAFAAGFNDDYIIVAQHPVGRAHQPNKMVTNYYIVPIDVVNDHWVAESAIGPLTLKEFGEKRNELRIPDDVSFTIEIEDLK